MCSEQGALTMTKAVRVSLLPEATVGEAFAEASRFRDEWYACLTVRGDELFELSDAVLCAPGAVHSAVELTLLPEHRRGHGAMYDALNRGRIDTGRLRSLPAGLPLPRFPDGRLVLAVDVSPWLRSDAPCSPDRLFCHVYGRAKTASQFIPGWPYSFVAVLEMGGRRSWTRSGSARPTTPRQSPLLSSATSSNDSSPRGSGSQASRTSSSSRTPDTT
jgi:hypothetical protein